MANITLKTPTSYEVDWSHPAFKGRKAIVIVGGKPVTKGKGELDYIVNAVDGTSRIDASAKGIAWHGTGVGTKVNLARVLGEHTSALVVMGSGSIRTNRSGGGYYIGYSALSLGGVQFGTGGSPSTSSRRNWSWASGNVCCIVPHATSMATAPMVYVDGCKRTPSDTGGTGTTISWGTASTDNYEVGYDPGNGTTNQNDRVVLAVFFSGALPEALVKSLSEDPWQLFNGSAPALYFSASGGAQTLIPSLVANTQTFHAPTVTTGAVTLAPSLVTNSQTFHAATVTTGAVTLAPSLVTNGQTFHAPTVSTGSVTLEPSLVTNGQTFYAPVVSNGGVTLAPSLVTNSQTFPSPTISVGAVTLTLDVVVNGQTFYAPTVAQPSGQTLEPTLVTNGQTFYGPTVEGMLLTQADLDAIAAAMWADPAAVAAHAKLDTIIARITC